MLLICGADVTLVNDDGQTSLELASDRLQKLLLESLHLGSDTRVLLHAAWMGDASVVKQLLV